MKQVKLSLIVAALLIAAACSSEPKQTQPVVSKKNSGTSTEPPAKEAQQRDRALVRVINAVPGTTGVDVFADNQKTFENVSFKTTTPYMEVPDSLRTFRVRQSGEDQAQPLAENTETLSGGKHYT